MTDYDYMKICFRLAKRGIGWTSPNPMVGAVVVQNDRIIGTGYHHRFGSPHAEVEAIRSAKAATTGATLYINLEPCCHFGKTPPCTDSIIASGISRVVCGMQDPHPLVAGKGIVILKQAGIDVVVGIGEDEARQLNEAFVLFHEKKRPFVAIKFAASLDGKIATKTGQSHWITSEKARLVGRSLRGRYQAILVGIGTVCADNPHLGTHTKGKRDPLRVILDSHLRLPITAAVLRDKNTLIVTTKTADPKKIRYLSDRGIELVQYDQSKITISWLLEELYRRQVISVLVEGGSAVLGSFVDEKLIDKVYAFHAPILIGGRQAVPAIAGDGVVNIKDALHLQQVSHRTLGDTILTTGYPSL